MRSKNSSATAFVPNGGHLFAIAPAHFESGLPDPVCAVRITPLFRLAWANGVIELFRFGIDLNQRHVERIRGLDLG
jgi:hypothetical protein